jgi:hypothetical protein
LLPLTASPYYKYHELTKCIKFDKIHVKKIQERHFLRIIKNNPNNLAKGLGWGGGGALGYRGVGHRGIGGGGILGIGGVVNK